VKTSRTVCRVSPSADGIMVEVHPNPREALCDGPQSLDLEGIRSLMDELRPIAGAVGRSLA